MGWPPRICSAGSVTLTAEWMACGVQIPSGGLESLQAAPAERCSFLIACSHLWHDAPPEPLSLFAGMGKDGAWVRSN
jgi:hypothetical protein